MEDSGPKREKKRKRRGGEGAGGLLGFTTACVSTVWPVMHLGREE